jgi:hypothetical protein
VKTTISRKHPKMGVVEITAFERITKFPALPRLTFSK